MTSSRRRYQAVSGWRLGAIGLLMAAVLLAGLSGGAGRAITETPLTLASEALGAPAPLSYPVAITGTRGLSVVAGLSEGRQRASQPLDAPTPHLPGTGLAAGGATVAVVAPRPPHLVLRGLNAVRAPPEHTPAR